jgi:outer membrane protein assembly factor BamD (BamD/ComL family)
VQNPKDILTHSNVLLFAVFSFFSLTIFGQEGVVYDLKKPPKFENRTLASEKSTNGKKFRKSRHFIQNTITHYNYYFNANVKLETVLARARSQNRDDYTHLLPFYNYTLEATAAQRQELDSVIYKCTTGILIHDTRNDWIDNLYLLIGKAYFLKKYFDSAFITFQFSNWAFAPHDKDGYAKPIGSNADEEEGVNELSVSTPEKRNILQKAFSLPPSRNDALLWKIRTYLARDQYSEAGSLIEVLKHDPQFPPRLAPELAEVQALSFYKQSNYDSAAWYLIRTLPAAFDNEEKARWEYLIAQLYEREKKSFEAKTYYDKVVHHTYNPILEVYARLNSIRQNKDAGEDFIRRNIEALVKMARKDRYESYRDIIYYTAAQMELERNNRPGAEAFLLKCIRSSDPINGTMRNKAFLQLANMSYEDKKYKAAKNYYDSLSINGRDNALLGDLSWLPERKAALAVIVKQLLIIDRQDSLQRIAALPPDQRDAYVKRLLKALRKLQGLKEDDQGDGSGMGPLNPNTAPDLFNAGANGNDWYFSNPSVKAKGYSDFKTKWGNRQNVDNWQLSSLVNQQKLANTIDRTLPGMPDMNGKGAMAGAKALSYKSLMDNLPLTPEKMKKSEDSVENALFALGKAYQEGILDYQSAIATYENLLDKFADTRYREESLLNLYYCYLKLGDQVNAARILALMKQRYPQSRFTAMAVNPDSTARAAGSLKVNATHQYEKIYISFIEGRFDEALSEKKTADSLYGDKYWTPQLLYIESVYFIRTRQDNRAKEILNNIKTRFPNTPMAAKATTLLDVLNRRKQIEDYLTNLKIKRAVDDSIPDADLSGQVTKTPDAPRLVRNDSNMLVREDTSTLARARIRTTNPSAIAGQKPASGLPGMNKLTVDPANLTQIKMDADELARVKLHGDSLLTAMKKAYSDSVALVRSGKLADSIKLVELKHRTDSIRAVLLKIQSDSQQLVSRIHSLNSIFAYTPEKPHSVVIVMDMVDPVYVAESKNAFNRYNQENFYNQSLTIENVVLNDSIKLVVIRDFGNAGSALEYLQKARASAPRETIPWLPANKYTFMIISDQNLDLLQSNKDLPAYRKFLSAAYPDKF